MNFFDNFVVPPNAFTWNRDEPEQPRDLSSKVIAIIVTYNGEKYIKRCLQSVCDNIKAQDILVIDNCSTDNTVKIVEEEFAGVTLVALNHNHGFGQANNIAFRMALDREADFVFLLNQDVYLQKNTIAALLRVAAENPHYAVLSPMHLNGNGTALDHHFSKYVAYNLISDLYLHTTAPVYNCRFVNAAAWLVSAKCLQQVGGFDPLFFQYGEDDDYLNRVRYNKWCIGVCPGTSVYHDRGMHHALETYTGYKKEHLHALKNLKNINEPFHKLAIYIYAGYCCDIIVNIFSLNFKTVFMTLRLSAGLLFQLRKVVRNRKKCKVPGAFLNGQQAYVVSLPVHDTASSPL